MLNTTLGFSLTVVNTNQYTINGQTLASASGNFGGQPSVGPSAVALPNNAFEVTAGSSTIQVNQPGHEKTTGNKIIFNNVNASNGFTNAMLNTTLGFSLTVINTNQYTINGLSLIHI